MDEKTELDRLVINAGPATGNRLPGPPSRFKLKKKVHQGKKKIDSFGHWRPASKAGACLALLPECALALDK
jgi:hypothetical protein